MTYPRLRRFNLIMGTIHGLQALAIVAISTDFTKTITTQYLVYDQQTQGLVAKSRDLFSVNIAYGIAAFAIVSMLFHYLIATKWQKSYEAGLAQGINRYRWYEYSISASIMIVLIAILSGIYDLGTLLLLFGLTAIMNLLGLVMELTNRTRKQVQWSSYWVGCLAGILPWVVIAIYFWGSATAPDGAGGPPTFVYFIWASLFFFFNCFALNMVLQYKKIGKWKDYLYGERAYIWLSLIAKSALLWQVFAGTLQP